MELADLFSKKALGDFLNKLFDALLKLAEERMKFNNQRFLNLSQAAEYCGMDAKYFYNVRKEPDAPRPIYPIEGGTKPFFDKEDLDRFMASRKIWGDLMEPVLAVLIGCLIYITVFILVSWLKDIFTGGKWYVVYLWDPGVHSVRRERRFV